VSAVTKTSWEGTGVNPTSSPLPTRRSTSRTSLSAQPTSRTALLVRSGPDVYSAVTVNSPPLGTPMFMWLL
jgi:hypothetical protein